MQEGGRRAGANGLALDMIVDGGGFGSQTAASAWMASARRHLQVLKAAGVRFDHLLLECWNPQPDRTLPMSDPDALASPF